MWTVGDLYIFPVDVSEFASEVIVISTIIQYKSVQKR